MYQGQEDHGRECNQGRENMASDKRDMKEIDNDVSFPEILRNDEIITDDNLSLDLTENYSFMTAASDSYDSLASLEDNLNLACTNARSIVEKLDSLATLFEECSLHFCLLTETWLTKKACSKKKMDDLTNGSNINMIRRDRGSRGGGVAICYNLTKLRLSRFPVPEEHRSREIICAVGSCSLTKRKLALISVYIPPQIKGSELDSYIYTLIDLVDKIKIKFADAIIFLGGDFNGKDMSRLVNAFPDLKATRTGATRNGAFLDEIYSNVEDCIKNKAILKPLTKHDGTPSDHAVIAASVLLPKHSKPMVKRFSFRPITKKGMEEIGELFNSYDWNLIKRASPTETPYALDQALNEMADKCFPQRKGR